MRHLLACSLASCVLAALPAQRAERSPHPAAAAAAKGFAGVGDFGGALTAVGPHYRATFGARSVTFEPALGKDSPAAATWRTETVRIARGSTQVLATAGTAPRVAHDRTSATLHWPGVAERYDARNDGLEQSFVFATPPPGDGDLVVRLAIATSLQRAADGTFAWRDGRGNGVVLGDVTGVDAIGARCRGSSRHVDGGVELVLPDWFVDAAVYPLTLDPLIGTSVLAYAGVDQDFPDVAYDAYSDSWCVVWTQFFGGGTTGVVGSVWDADTMALGYAFGINQPGDEDSVRVTNIAGSGLFVIVWVNYATNGSSISGLALEPVQAQATAVFTIDGPGALGAPVVSGEATLFDDDCLVVWLDDAYGVLGCTVAIDQQLQVSGSPIVQIAGGNATEPAISKQGGNPGMHLVTWIDRPPGLPGWVRAQVVDNDMNLVGPGVWLQNTPQDCGFPACDGDGTKFLVAWEEQEVANPSATDVRGRIVTIGAAGVTSVGGVLDLASAANDVAFAVDVARLHDKFGITYMVAVAAPPFADDCWFRSVSGLGVPIGSALQLDVTPGTAHRYEHAPRVIGRCAGDSTLAADDGLVVFADQNVTTFDSDVGLQGVEAMGPGGPIIDLGGGCGPGGLASSPGPAALGNGALALELFGAQPLAVPFLFLGVPAPLVTCGACTVIQPITVTFVPSTAGAASWPLAIPGTASLAGFQLDFQYVTFNVAYVGCPLVPGVAASNIVRATLGQ